MRSLGCSLLLLLILLCASQASWGQEKPNIVLVFLDNFGWGEPGFNGGGIIRGAATPRIDQIAAEGLRLTNFNVEVQCTPSRSAIMTGRYAIRSGNGTVPLGEGVYGLVQWEITMAEMLSAAGYATGMFGKWHLGYQPPYMPTQHGFDEFRGLLTGDGDHHSHISRSGTEDWWHDEHIEMEEGYSVELITKHSIDFIEKHRNEPFFLYVAHLAIHFPWQGPGEQGHRIKGRDYWNLSKLGPHKPDQVGPVVREMVEATDKSVGEIMVALKRLGLDNNTFVFFTSDNGGYLNYANQFNGEISSNGPLRGQKGDVFEGGHRVPAIARWPGRIKPGTLTHETTMTMDLMPTYLELAKEKTPGYSIDGSTLTPVLFKGQTMPERDLFWRKGKEWAVRRGPWKLVRDEKGEIMLFNLDEDLAEQKNLAKEKPERVEQLLTAYKEWENDIAT